jgi:uncharacterized protein
MTEAVATAADAGSYAQSDKSTPNRLPQLASYDRALVHTILDAARVCHLGFVRDGRPVVLPTLYVRVDDHVYVHGSGRCRPMAAAARTSPAGLPVCLTVTHIDGLILGRSAFRHSIQYRSVVAHGAAHPVTDPDERDAALTALVEHVVPGRSRDCRMPSDQELEFTAMLRLDLEEVSAKVRDGGPYDEPADEGLPHWSGVIPMETAFGTPVPADDLTSGVELPGYIRDLVG